MIISFVALSVHNHIQDVWQSYIHHELYLHHYGLSKAADCYILFFLQPATILPFHVFLSYLRKYHMKPALQEQPCGLHKRQNHIRLNGH